MADKMLQYIRTNVSLDEKAMATIGKRKGQVKQLGGEKTTKKKLPGS